MLAMDRKKCYNRVDFRWWEVNVVVDSLGSRLADPIIKSSLVDPVGSLRHEVRGRVGQGIKVEQNSSGEVNRLDEILSNDHYVISARDEIFVTVVIHQDAIIVGKLAILPETIGTVRIVASLDLTKDCLNCYSHGKPRHFARDYLK